MPQRKTIELETERFDTIVSLAVLEHIEHPASLLKKFKEMLNPMGHIILTVPHPRLEWIHKTGSKMGLFSQYAGQDRKQRIDYNHMQNLAKTTGLAIVKYSRFLFGANQLFMLTKPWKDPHEVHGFPHVWVSHDSMQHIKWGVHSLGVAV